jgi:hypothetical protein
MRRRKWGRKRKRRRRRRRRRRRIKGYLITKRSGAVSVVSIRISKKIHRSKVCQCWWGLREDFLKYLVYVKRERKEERGERREERGERRERREEREERGEERE